LIPRNKTNEVFLLNGIWHSAMASSVNDGTLHYPSLTMNLKIC